MMVFVTSFTSKSPVSATILVSTLVDSLVSLYTEYQSQTRASHSRSEHGLDANPFSLISDQCSSCFPTATRVYPYTITIVNLSNLNPLRSRVSVRHIPRSPTVNRPIRHIESFHEGHTTSIESLESSNCPPRLSMSCESVIADSTDARYSLGCCGAKSPISP